MHRYCIAQITCTNKSLSFHIEKRPRNSWNSKILCWSGKIIKNRLPLLLYRSGIGMSYRKRDDSSISVPARRLSRVRETPRARANRRAERGVKWRPERGKRAESDAPSRIPIAVRMYVSPLFFFSPLFPPRDFRISLRHRGGEAGLSMSRVSGRGSPAVAAETVPRATPSWCAQCEFVQSSSSDIARGGGRVSE